MDAQQGWTQVWPALWTPSAFEDNRWELRWVRRLLLPTSTCCCHLPDGCLERAMQVPHLQCCYFLKLKFVHEIPDFEMAMNLSVGRYCVAQAKHVYRFLPSRSFFKREDKKYLTSFYLPTKWIDFWITWLFICLLDQSSNIGTGDSVVDKTDHSLQSHRFLIFKSWEAWASTSVSSFQIVFCGAMSELALKNTKKVEQPGTQITLPCCKWKSSILICLTWVYFR